MIDTQLEVVTEKVKSFVTCKHDLMPINVSFFCVVRFLISDL